jgi:uncharacterized membrane protein YbaN (DUF454 family)
MKHSGSSFKRKALGSGLIALGVLGVIVPIIPGWPLLIPGALLLGFNRQQFVKLLDRWESRFPSHQRALGHLRRTLDRHSPAETKGEESPSA